MFAETGSFKFQITLKIIFCKDVKSGRKKYSPLFYFSFKSHETIFSRIQKWLREVSAWEFCSNYGDYINISVYTMNAFTGVKLDLRRHSPKLDFHEKFIFNRKSIFQTKNLTVCFGRNNLKIQYFLSRTILNIP